MAGFGELDAVFHRLTITNFADEDDVRRLTQSVLERQMPAIAIDTDFAVRDDAAFVRVYVLHRVLDGHYVTPGLFVPITHHGGERGGFTASRAADENHEAALRQHDVLQDQRQLEFFEGGNLRVDGSQHRAGEPLLNEGADSKAADSRRRDCKIAFLGGIELLGLPVVHDRPNQARALLRGQSPVGLRADFAVDLDRGGKSGCYEQVGTFFLHHPPKQVLHQAYCLIALHLNAVLILRLVFRFFPAHHAFLHQFLQALVERLHTLSLSGLYRRIHLGDFALADQVSNS